MKYILNALEKYGIGSRPQTEDDFYRICEEENIEVVFSNKKYSFYFTDPKIDVYCITLAKRRKGLRLLHEMFHELGHHFMHSGNDPAAGFSGLTHTKDEAEAEAVSLISLMPKSQIKSHAFFDNSRYGTHLYNERLRLYFLYGI